MIKLLKALSGDICSRDPRSGRICVKGGFPLSPKFFVRTDVNLAGFTYVNRIRSDV